MRRTVPVVLTVLFGIGIAAPGVDSLADGPERTSVSTVSLPTAAELGAELAALPDAAARAAHLRSLGAPDRSDERCGLLRPFIDDPDAALREGALHGIAACGWLSDAASDSIAADAAVRLGDPSARVRFAAIDVMRLTRDPDAAIFAALAARCAEPTDAEHARPWLSRAMARRDSRCRTIVTREMSSEVPARRLAAALLLPALHRESPADADRAAALLGDSSAAVQRAAAHAIGALGEDASLALRSALLAALTDGTSRCRAEAASALGRILRTSSTRSIHSIRAVDTDLALSAGVRWLTSHQERDGSFDSDGFERHDPRADVSGGRGAAEYDVGLTAMAAIVLGRADGRGTAASSAGDETSESADRALRFLAANTAADGRTSGSTAHKHWIYEHAISTWAFCEAFERSGDPLWESLAQRGLDLLAAARNPEGAWRYGVRPGDNDVSVSAWCAWALSAGRRAGLRVDESHAEGVLRYLDSVTDESGHAGYAKKEDDDARLGEVTASHPPELSEAMTAAALAQRVILGAGPRESVAAGRAVKRVLALRPKWGTERGRIDMYYWHAATDALRRIGGDHWRVWKADLHEALLDGQCAKASGSRAGSWDPVGPWGIVGGRIYSTAICVLSLQQVVEVAPPAGSDSLDASVSAVLDELRKVAADAGAPESVRIVCAREIASFERL